MKLTNDIPMKLTNEQRDAISCLIKTPALEKNIINLGLINYNSVDVKKTCESRDKRN